MVAGAVQCCWRLVLGAKLELCAWLLVPVRMVMVLLCWLQRARLLRWTARAGCCPLWVAPVVLVGLSSLLQVRACLVRAEASGLCLVQGALEAVAHCS